MNSLNSKILFLSLFIFYNSFAQTDSTPLLIQTNRDSTGFFIDNKFFGIGKNLTLYIAEGTHTIYLVESIKQWDAEFIKDTIMVEGINQLKLEYHFKEKILINTIPQDVSAYEKDSLMGFTPAYIESGFTELQLKKLNYQNINVSFSEVSWGEKPELKFTGEPPETPFYGSALFALLLGTAIALGATTAYLKLEADDKFEEYTITGDPELIDEVNQYDVASATTLVIFELNVALIIYFFLSE